MNIGSVSMNISNINTQTKVGIAMLDKSLEASQEVGMDMVDMMTKSLIEQSVTPNLGSNVDMYI